MASGCSVLLEALASRSICCRRALHTVNAGTRRSPATAGKRKSEIVWRGYSTLNHGPSKPLYGRLGWKFIAEGRSSCRVLCRPCGIGLAVFLGYRKAHPADAFSKTSHCRGPFAEQLPRRASARSRRWLAQPSRDAICQTQTCSRPRSKRLRKATRKRLIGSGHPTFSGWLGLRHDAPQSRAAGRRRGRRRLECLSELLRGAAAGRFPNVGDPDDLWRLLVVITFRKAPVQCGIGQLKRGGDLVRGESVFASNASNSGPSGLVEMLALSPPRNRPPS